MASLEVGAQAATAVPAVSAADVKITKAAVLPGIREAADQFAKTKSATVDQMTESVEKINKALETINDKLRQSSTSLAFSVDSASERMIIQVTDQESGEVLFTFPGEASLKVAAQINKQLDAMKGVLFDDKL
jgi:flagellar protein FlaG|tara:strand:+ start:1295 stop:1690 length:396 start_codon:yes stop_codon:yes gene_type:complete